MLASIKKMKLLSKRISEILKSVLLCNLLLIGGLYADVVSSDKFLLKILDRTISLDDITYQLRNIKALDCIYDDALVIQFFEKKFIKDLDKFVKNFPAKDDEARKYMHLHEGELLKIRQFFKILRYSEDQKTEVSPALAKLIRESTNENKCGTGVLHKETLKTNFISLLEMELYFRARYGVQLKNNQKFDVIKTSVELFVESLDKQFTHEYYW